MVLETSNRWYNGPITGDLVWLEWQNEEIDEKQLSWFQDFRLQNFEQFGGSELCSIGYEIAS